MAEKKVLEITLHDNGREECYLAEMEGMEIKRLTSALLTLMSRGGGFAEIISFCAAFYAQHEGLVDKKTKEAIAAAQKVN